MRLAVSAPVCAQVIRVTKFVFLLHVRILTCSRVLSTMHVFQSHGSFTDVTQVTSNKNRKEKETKHTRLHHTSLGTISQWRYQLLAAISQQSVVVCVSVGNTYAVHISVKSTS